MAVIWQSGNLKQYCPSIRNESDYWRDLALKASYVFLHQLDLILTMIAASLGLTEVNPLIRGLLGAPLYLMAIKLAMPLFIACLFPGKYLLPAILFLGMVVGWNVKELLLLLF